MRLVLATVCIVATAEDRALPHVVAGHYDRTWEPDETTSLGELRRSVSRAEAWAGVLVAALDDTGDDPARPAPRATTRRASRCGPRSGSAPRGSCASPSRRSTWDGPWLSPGAAGRACGAVLLEPRDDWAALQRDGALRSTRVHTYGDGRHARGQLARLAMDSVRVDRFTFQNDLDYTIKLHWFDIGMEEGVDANRSPYGEVAEVRPGADATIGTSVGHVFAVSDADGHFISKVTHVYDLAMEKRKALSDVQIAVTPNVTADGFKLIKTPPHVYDKVIQFYNASHDRIRRPEADGGPLYNQRRIQTWHTPLEGRLKAYVFDELKRLMEDWAPTTAPLKGTSAYGVRTYERGAYLHLHVDTANTHVVSGIMNVAQAGVDEPWPLEILDHAGKLHAVNMEPGDFLLYESARLLHGRPRPFRGDSYANIFVHYMPEHDWSVDF
ncbi:hypothetical protein JL722_1597 [Aureococcus anophagefferens]|nr:hypothetical protein JL722_1597 [Aureococcus anophagefferens]